MFSQLFLKIRHTFYSLLFYSLVLIIEKPSLLGSELPTQSKSNSSLKLPKDQTQWETWKNTWMRALQKNCFSNWPKESVPLNAQEKFSAQSNNISLRAIEFDGPAGRRCLYISHYPGLEEPDLVVLTTVGNEGWKDFLAAMRPGFEKELGFENLPEPNLKSFQQHQGMYRSFKWAMACMAPSGIGPNSLPFADGNEDSRLDAIRVLELRKAVKALRSAGGMAKVPVWLQGQGDMAAVSLYAGLFEPDIARFDLHDLPKSHRQSSFLKNALPILDLPQTVALALENSQLILYQDDKKGWGYPASTAKQLEWNNRLQIRTPRPSK
jgi:hypothetical protein